MDCPHEHVENNECQDCGLELECLEDEQVEDFQQDGVYAIQRPAKKQPFNYLEQLARLELDPSVYANVGEQISRLQDRSHVRRGTRIKNLFAMIYIAHAQLSLEFDQTDIGSKLEMSTKEIRDAVKIASAGIDSKADRNPICITSPNGYIRKIAEMFKDYHNFTEDNFNKISDFIDLIFDHNKMLYNEHPEGIAVTIIKMYLDHNKIVVPDFLKKVGRTGSYIKLQENMIVTTLNMISRE